MLWDFSGETFAMEKVIKITPPFDNDMLLRKQKSIKRQLLAQDSGLDKTRQIKRIAILGGSTTADIKNLLEIFLLDAGIKPVFYESEYNKFYEDAVFGNEELSAFNPEIIIIFTSVVNLISKPFLTDTAEQIEEKIDNEYHRYQNVWNSLSSRFPSSVIIQNNFDFSFAQPEGTSILPQSRGRFINILNEKFTQYAHEHSGFYIHNLNRLCASIGLARWHNRSQYHAYKFAMNYDVIPDVAWSLKRLICSILGRVKKCLVLDLDNTLWGGVIGDDGLNGIEIGKETPRGEAFTEFQEYVKALKDRGVILAVSSKNDEDVAKSGFTHPDSVLRIDDFVSFHANWEPKNVNIRQIAKEINIGLDSLVFIDDNPAERAIVRETVPEVSVPDVDPVDISSYITAIEINGYFDTVSISDDDLKRTRTYQENKERAILLEASAGNYEEFLQSLDMEAEVLPFSEIYYDRITQLTNKSNQFNLTTKRFTLAEIKNIAEDKDKYITLYCRLKDRFGDNGVISLIVGEMVGAELRIVLWLMSCRVLKRGVEDLMLDCIVDEARRVGCQNVVGFYYPTKKNSMVKDHYKNFGFTLVSENTGNTEWELSIDMYTERNRFIKIMTGDNHETGYEA